MNWLHSGAFAQLFRALSATQSKPLRTSLYLLYPSRQKTTCH